MEDKTKFETLREDLRQVPQDYDPRCATIIRRELPTELYTFANAYRSDQTTQCYFALLINLVIMSQGSIWTEEGSYRLLDQDISMIKAVLRGKVDYVDRQFAYICYLIQRLGVLNKQSQAELVRLAAVIQDSAMSLASLKNTSLILLVRERIAKELESEAPSQRQSLLRILDNCIKNLGSPEFDPLAESVGYSVNEGETLQRFFLSNTGNDVRYHESLTQFNGVEFRENLTDEMQHSVSELIVAARGFYLGPDVRMENRKACAILMNDLFKFTDEAARILKFSERKGFSNTAAFSNLIHEAEKIHQSINDLASKVPQDLHWGKILGVMLGTLFVGLLWIIPSLTCSGSSSFFRRTSPVVVKSRELVYDIQDKMDELNQVQDDPIDKPLLEVNNN